MGDFFGKSRIIYSGKSVNNIVQWIDIDNVMKLEPT